MQIDGKLAQTWVAIGEGVEAKCEETESKLAVVVCPGCDNSTSCHTSCYLGSNTNIACLSLDPASPCPKRRANLEPQENVGRRGWAERERNMTALIGRPTCS